MAEVIRPLGYTGAIQRLVIDNTNVGTVTAYLWGGGGGGGAPDSPGSGGNGGGGGFAQISFVVGIGDVIDVAVGGHGGAGQGSRLIVGGTPGSSYINGADSYSGATGGQSGPVGSSGSGGGGGGATVLLLNGTVIAVAGGGGGGGGGGNQGAVNGQSAPGTAGQASPGINAGQDGGDNLSDGGGGGAGGGGYGGGNAGIAVYYDQGGTAGSNGGNFGTATAEPSGTQPGNAFSAYRFGTPGLGGLGGGGGGTSPTFAGTSGQATMVFEVAGSYVKDAGVWKPVQELYVKSQGVWKSVQELYVKQNGQWQIVTGTNATAPVFAYVAGNFGVSSRPEPPQ